MWRAIELKEKKINLLVVSNSVCRVSLTDFPRELNSTYISIEISFQNCVAKKGWEREGGSGYCRWFRCLLSSSGWITITLIDKTPPPPTYKVLPALCHCFGWTTCMCSFAPHIEKKGASGLRYKYPSKALSSNWIWLRSNQTIYYPKLLDVLRMD